MAEQFFSPNDGKKLRDLLAKKLPRRFAPVNSSEPILLFCAVNNWNFPRKIFNFLSSLTNHELPINELEFVRMARTILLKRVLDVSRKTIDFHYRVDKASVTLRELPQTVRVPAPIYDLLYSLGRFKSAKTDYFSNIAVPCPAHPPENFWSVDKEILDKWLRTMELIEPRYEIRDFPDDMDFKHKPMMQCRYELYNGHVQIKSHTTEIKPEHVLVRFVNGNILGYDGFEYDDLTQDLYNYSVSNCDLPADTFDSTYLASYVKGA